MDKLQVVRRRPIAALVIHANPAIQSSATCGGSIAWVKSHPGRSCSRMAIGFTILVKTHGL